MNCLFIIDLEKKLLDPTVRKTPEELKKLLSEDFVEFGSSGRVYNRDIVIEHLAIETSERIEAFDFTVTELAPGCVQLRFHTKRQSADGSISRSLRSSIWKLFGTDWRMVFHQGTPTNL